MTRRKKIYIAGPLFNELEQEFNRMLKDKLSRWFDVFLPQEDGELLVDLIARGISVGVARMRVFQRDLQAIQNCDIILVLLDGRVVDEGAAFELGMAYSLGKECWGLKTDARRLLASGDNPMIEGALKECFGSVHELIQFAEGIALLGAR
jgi:nucleoside 2-deoxyribosyltransferase